MVDRILLGNSGSGYDLLVSKPGIDVKTAAAGQLLLGKNTGAQQILASDYTKLAGPPTVYTNQTYTISLPSIVAGLSNLLVWGILYVVNDYAPTGVDSSQQYVPGYPCDGLFQVVNGSLIITSNLGVVAGTTNYPTELWAQWVIFRFQY